MCTLVQDLGGTITCDDIARVEGVLAVTRAFGNNAMKRIVQAEPELREHVLAATDEFLVIASDGVWDMVSNDRAVRCSMRCCVLQPMLAHDEVRLRAMRTCT